MDTGRQHRHSFDLRNWMRGVPEKQGAESLQLESGSGPECGIRQADGAARIPVDPGREGG